MSCTFAHDDGAYVLGALAPAERLRFERHLPHCVRCSHAVGELAGLPGLLGRVEPSILEDPTPDVPVPDTLLPGLSRVVRRGRRRTTAAVCLAGAAAAAVAVLVPVASPWGLGDGTAPAPSSSATATPSEAAPQAMDPVGDVPVRASVRMEPVTWGTRLELTCTYDPDSVEYELPPAVDYLMVVRTRDGQTEPVGSWRSVGGRTMRLSAATASSRDEIASVEVRAPNGRVVLELSA